MRNLLKNIIGITLLTCFSFQSMAQSPYLHQVWMQYRQTAPLSENVFFKADAGVRSTNWMNDWNRNFFRVGLGYTLNENWNLSGGGAFFKLQNADESNIIEYRVYGDATKNYSFKGINMMNGIRIENRNFYNSQAEGMMVTTKWRARLKIGFTQGINSNELKENTFYVGFYDELFFHFAGNINQVFEYNRLEGKCGYYVSNKLNFSLSYTVQTSYDLSSKAIQDSRIIWFGIQQIIPKIVKS